MHLSILYLHILIRVLQVWLFASPACLVSIDFRESGCLLPGPLTGVSGPPLVPAGRECGAARIRASLAGRSYWDIALPRLLELFSGAPVDKELSELVCNCSITEWEFKYAVLKEEHYRHPANLRMAWFHREYMGGVPAGVDSTDFDDVTGNDDRCVKLDNLKTWVNSIIQRDLCNKLDSHGGFLIV